jgi:aminopeptidase YwaD
LFGVKKGLIMLCCLFVCAGCATKPLEDTWGQLALSPETRLTQYVQELSAPGFAGRQAGSAGEAQAGLYLARFMQKAGIMPQGERGTYFQTLPLKKYEPVLVDKRLTFRLTAQTGEKSSENILGLWPGQSDEIIIISAHYDHLGVIDNKLYPGANDNASGVAAIMELVTAIQQETLPYTVLFAFWGAEEMGLLGSEHFCANPTVGLEKIKYVLNLDSIGNLSADKKLLGWRTTPHSGDHAIPKLISAEGWSISWEVNEKHSSDHAPFAKRGIAGCTLLSPQWLLVNHTPQDRADAVNSKVLAEVVSAIKKALLT